METKGKTNNPKSWDDLVFEDRNVDYGAYAVRKSYTGNLTSGFLLSVSFGGLLFVVPMVMSLFDDDDRRNDSGLPVIPKNDTLVFTQVDLILPPPPPPGPTHPHVTPPIEPPVTSGPPVVTTDAPEDATITANVDIPPATPSVAEGVPGGVDGGTGTDPSITDPVTHGDPEYYLAPQVQASYTGGLEAMYSFIRSKFHYPASARRMGLEGTVYVSFVIGRDGKVIKVEVIKGLSPDCDKEAARVIALMPGWNPGRQNDVPVMVRMTLPIKFALDNSR